MSFEKYVLPDEVTPGEYPKLNIHMFRGVLNEYLDGEKTGPECRTVIQEQLGVTLTADDITNLNTIITYINGGADLAAKIKRADESYRVFVLARSGCSWYNTREKIRTRLSFSV
jgi:hypothetical protein